MSLRCWRGTTYAVRRSHGSYTKSYDAYPVTRPLQTRESGWLTSAGLTLATLPYAMLVMGEDIQALQDLRDVKGNKLFTLVRRLCYQHHLKMCMGVTASAIATLMIFRRR